MTDTIRTHVAGTLVGESSASVFTIPSNYRVIARILEDVISHPSMDAVRRRFADCLSNNGEFRALRQDVAYKVITSLSGQPRRGSSVRRGTETSDMGK